MTPSTPLKRGLAEHPSSPSFGGVGEVIETLMSKIKLEVPFQSFRGKVCKHSQIIFKVMYGTRFTSQVCNPFTGAPSEAQTAQKTKFKNAQKAMQTLTTQECAAYAAAFKKNPGKYKILNGYILAQELAKLS